MIREICLYEYDAEPCGWAISVDENSKIEIIATIPINWLYWRM